MHSMVSFPDLALNNPSNSLIRYIEEKFQDVTCETISDSPDDLKNTFSRSSTESEISYDPKGRTDIFSSSTDTITPVLFINDEIIRTLEHTNSKPEKLYILNAILHAQPDTYYYENLFKILRENLNENDNDMFEITLEIHEKCINSSWEMAKNSFINLLEALYLYYCSMDITEIYTDRYPYRNCIKICRLVLNMFNDIFFHMPRFGYKRLEKIIGNFLDLLFVSLSAKDCSTLTPLNIMSYLDITAKWCKILVYGAGTREIVFTSIRRNSNFMKYLLQHIIEFLNEPNVPKLKMKDIVPYPVIRYMTVVNCMFICKYVFNYKSFYDLFANNAVESRMSLNVNSFTISLISFLKSKHKVIPAQLTDCMIDCTVSLVQFQSAECVTQNLQYILETSSNRQVKKNMLEVVRKMLENENLAQNLMNFVLHTRRSRMSVNTDGKLLRPRPNSVATSRQNIFTTLMGAVTNVLKYSNNQTSIIHGFSITASIFQYHDIYLLFGLNFAPVREFVELLAVKYDDVKDVPEDIVLSLEKLLFSMGSTTLGFYFLSQSTTGAQNIMSGLTKRNLSWYMLPWKSTVSFIMHSEAKADTITYLQKVNSEILELLNQIIEHEYENDSEMKQIVEKIFIFVDMLSHSLHAFLSATSYAAQDKPTPENGSMRVTSVMDFIEKYALTSSYEYELQHLALQILKKMVRRINSRTILLSYLNYEECLAKIHGTYVTDNGEIIIDECSILRSELLNGNFSFNEESQQYRVKTANRSSRRTSAKSTYSRKKLSDLQKFLQETKFGLYDTNWIRQARKVFKTSLYCEIKISIFVELIEKTAKSIVKPTKIRKIVASENSNLHKLYPEDYKGICLAVRYGIKNHILQQNSTNEENLAQLIKIIRNFNSSNYSENLIGFDCILATLFIMCAGSVDKCLQIVSYVVPLPVTVFIWPQVTPTFMEKRYLFGHLLEWLLYQEVPNVFSALSVYGISWWLICKCQLDDCFWNTMDWLNICRWFCITILYPPDNLMYFFTSVAFKNESKILQTTNENDLRDVLHVIFSSYKFGEHFMYIDYLFKKYHFYLSSFLID